MSIQRPLLSLTPSPGADSAPEGRGSESSGTGRARPLGGRRTRSVVLVEDDPAIRESLVELLKSEGYQVASLPNGLEALRHLRSARRPDVIVLDLLMPVMDGWEFRVRQKRDPALASIPVLVLSADSSPQAAAIDAAAYIKKPVDAETFLHAVERVVLSVERTRAEEALRRSEANFRALIESSPDAILVHRNGRLLYANPAVLSFLGRSGADEILGQPVVELLHPDDRELTAARIRSTIAGTRHPARELRLLRQDGGVVVTEVIDLPILFGGEPAVMAILRDVTERRRAAEARVRLAAIVESTDDAIMGVTLDGCIESWNGGAERIYGYAADDVLGQPLALLVPPRLSGELAQILERTRSGEPVRNLETIWRRKDGREIEVSLTVSPLRDPAGDVIGRSAISRDISERKKLEAQLLLSDRMASMGTLAAGVAHEINNPLTYVVANLDYAQTDLARALSSAEAEPRPQPGSPEGLTLATLLQRLDAVVDTLREAREGAERVRLIVRDLKTFARAEERPTSLVDVRRLLESSINLAWNEIRHRAHLVKYYDEVPPVEANESRLGQVFLNLLVNAAQAIPEGAADRNEIRVSTSCDDSGRVVVEVRDSGSGIHPEILGRIFDPYFTTKPVGGGSGIGLAICHGIVSSLGGEIAVDTAVGRGTAFRVSLPQSPPPAPPENAIAAQPAGPPAATSRRGRILVIDDEPIIGGALRRLLSAEHEVEVHAKGRTALERIAAGERYDLIFCDLMMPEMTGMDLHAALARAAPELLERMVFLTGGAFTARAQAFLEEIPNLRVEKPFDNQQILALVRSRLR